MHFLYFNSIVAALVLFGMVTAAPVPREDDISVSPNPEDVGIGVDVGVGVGVGVKE